MTRLFAAMALCALSATAASAQGLMPNQPVPAIPAAPSYYPPQPYYGPEGQTPCRDAERASAKAPKVVSTFPANGAVVRPGLLVVRVTFNQPMACDAAFAGAEGPQAPCFGDKKSVFLSADRRSYLGVCQVRENASYELPLSRFKSRAGSSSAPIELKFSTSSQAPAATLREALGQDAAAGETIGRISR